MVTCTAVYAMYAFSISIYSHALHSIQLESFANHSYMQTKNERNGKKKRNKIIIMNAEQNMSVAFSRNIIKYLSI